MISIRRALTPALAATIALGVAVPAASASALPTPYSSIANRLFPSQALPWFAGGSLVPPTGITSSSGPCGTSTGVEGQGATGGTTAQICAGAGLTFVGPAIGQIATVIGPTIIGPAVIGNIVVSAGNASAG
jgi:hypothetical protein